jgi:hypothetical protein
MLAQDIFQSINSPVTVNSQRASGPRFGDARATRYGTFFFVSLPRASA